MNIVSLLPSATEIICSIGLLDQLVGVTHECDYPPAVTGLPKVTRTLIPHDVSSREIDSMVRQRLQAVEALYSLDLEVLERLRPDLIVTQALCDVCAVAETEVNNAACHLPGQPRVINLEPMSLEDVLQTMLLVGEATGNPAAARQAVVRCRNRIDAVQSRTKNLLRPDDLPRVVFLEWVDPPFNPGHWNPELIELAGGIDCIGNKNRPATTSAWEHIVARQPDVLFVACCGFDVRRTLVDMALLTTKPGWQELPCVRNGRVYVTDGNAYFSRPGPRLVDSLEILAHALHPLIHPLPEGVPAALTWPLNAN